MQMSPDPADTFRQEAAELLEQLEATLLDLEGAPENHALVDQAFRALHTIKGSGGMFGFDAVAAFTHRLETAFEAVRSGRRPATPALITLTLSSLDHIRSLIVSPDTAEPSIGAALLAALADLDGPVAAAPLVVEAKADVPPLPLKTTTGGTLSRWTVRFRLAENVMSFGTNPLLLLKELRDLAGDGGRCTVTALTDRVPLLEDLDPFALHVAWEVDLVTAHEQADIEDVFIFVADDAQIEITRHEEEKAIAQTTQPVASVIAALTPAAPPQAARPSPPSAPEGAGSIRVQAERLDSLMDQVGELVIAQARLRQLSLGGDPALLSVVEEVERLVSDLRDTTMSIRMLPIGTLFGRFRRVVRDLSQALGKEVMLTTEGEDTELDKTVIESLNDPLVHLIRNSIDHGLETAEERRAAGKSGAGTVHLSAVHAGAQVLITVSDDGRGMNREAIRAKAEERGLIAPGAEVPDSELLGLVFEAGFSTAAVVSDVSGRGVGMDVVRQTVDALRGSLMVDSPPGRGASVTLRLPLTLAIIDGLLVQVSGGQYVIPLAAVEECVDLTPAEDARWTRRNFLNLRGDLVPFLRMRDLFGVPERPEGFQKVVIVTSGGMRVGLVVDHVIGQYQTVIKSLSRLLDEANQFSGATILGDGSVALILDVAHLIDFAQALEAERKAS